jgi:hypothetical protein
MYEERQFLRLCRHTRIMARQHQRKGTVGENQHWQKEIIIHWKGLLRKITELLQHGWQQTWIFILKNLFPQKLSDLSFTNPTFTVGLQLLNLILLKVNLRCVNDGVTTIKRGRQTIANARVMWLDESSFTLFPTSGRVYVWGTQKEADNAEYLVPTVKHGGGSVIVKAAISCYSILLVPLLSCMAKLQVW